jgi:Fe-S-cluster containining protein
MNELEPKCEQCGLCCQGYTFWLTNRSFDNDELGIKKLMEYHGLTPLRNAKGQIGVHIPGDCVHIDKSNGKFRCKIYETRPVVCREYFCEKVIKKALEGIADGLHV